MGLGLIHGECLGTDESGASLGLDRDAQKDLWRFEDEGRDATDDSIGLRE